MILILVFFFSSRRRHTRWPRDWSSDVCSSDLTFFYFGRRDHESGRYRPADDQFCKIINRFTSRRIRSEERRVGKVCRLLLMMLYGSGCEYTTVTTDRVTIEVKNAEHGATIKYG